MIQRRHQQRNLFEAVIGSVEQLMEGLIEPALKRLDEVLADDTLLDAVMQQLATRRPHSRSRGRPGTPGEVALRMLVLKRLKGWSFEQTNMKYAKIWSTAIWRVSISNRCPTPKRWCGYQLQLGRSRSRDHGYP